MALYQYMRLCGYPAHRIAILTTYNGQKQLLRDVVARRCAAYPVFGEPSAIETVDKYQGQQADYVLLSLVRTRTVGHLRDVRRLVVALSRARLGLYVFGRAAVFANCYELARAFSQLIPPIVAGGGGTMGFAADPARPLRLQLVLGEAHPTPRPEDLPGGAEAAVAASGGALRLVEVDSPQMMGRVVADVIAAHRTMVATMGALAAFAAGAVAAPASAASAAGAVAPGPAAAATTVTATVGGAGSGAEGAATDGAADAVSGGGYSAAMATGAESRDLGDALYDGSGEADDDEDGDDGGGGGGSAGR